MTARIVRLVALVLLVFGASLIGPAPSRAATIQTGWWWKANTGRSPEAPAVPVVPAPNVTLPVAPPAPPTPPNADGGLQVAALQDGAFAVAAVRVDAELTSLTLRVAPNGDANGMNAKLVACTAVTQWQPVAGGELPAWEIALQAALPRLRKDGLKPAVQQLKQGMAQAQGGRARFFWQLVLARLCSAAKKHELAKTQLESLDQTLQASGLGEWEPDLALEVLRLLHNCYELLPQNHAIRERKVHKMEELKLVALDEPTLDEIAKTVDRQNTWELAVSGGTIYLTVGSAAFELTPQILPL